MTSKKKSSKPLFSYPMEEATHQINDDDENPIFEQLVNHKGEKLIGRIYLPYKIWKKIPIEKQEFMLTKYEIIIPDYIKLSQRIIHFIKTVDKDDIDAFWKKYDNFWKSFNKAMNNVLGPEKDHTNLLSTKKNQGNKEQLDEKLKIKKPISNTMMISTIQYSGQKKIGVK